MIQPYALSMAEGLVMIPWVLLITGLFLTGGYLASGQVWWWTWLIPAALVMGGFKKNLYGRGEKMQLTKAEARDIIEQRTRKFRWWAVLLLILVLAVVIILLQISTPDDAGIVVYSLPQGGELIINYPGVTLNGEALTPIPKHEPSLLIQVAICIPGGLLVIALVFIFLGFFSRDEKDAIARYKDTGELPPIPSKKGGESAPNGRDIN